MNKDNSADNKKIIFENPIDDLVKISFRICDLIEKIFLYQEKSLPDQAEFGIFHIIELLNILERPELRGKYFSAYTQALHAYQKLSNSNSICQAKLHSVLSLIDKQLSLLGKGSGKFELPLKENAFFVSLRQRLQPNSTDNNNPLLQFWQSRPCQDIQDDFKQWCQSFADIKQIAEFHKQLLIQSNPFIEEIAKLGYRQYNIAPKCQLIRVRLAKVNECFPSISTGHRGVGIQFMQIKNFNEPAKKVHDDVVFDIASCYWH